MATAWALGRPDRISSATFEENASGVSSSRSGKGGRRWGCCSCRGRCRGSARDSRGRGGPIDLGLQRRRVVEEAVQEVDPLTGDAAVLAGLVDVAGCREQGQAEVHCGLWAYV